jgi:hypothetical protein
MPSRKKLRSAILAASMKVKPMLLELVRLAEAVVHMSGIARIMARNWSSFVSRD